MLCIQNNSNDPYFNLASEEYLLRNFKEDCFMLYLNRASIIVGKHQNTLAEINYEFVRNHKIDVVRRLSGGGTVFHDLGNLNFMFIQNVEKEGNLVDFKKFTKPVIEVLNQLGANAKFEGRNDIMINGRKISGNAEHVYKKRVLHHGTLLFSSEIKNLSRALKVNPLKYEDKGVKSVRSRVTNIKEHLSYDITIDQFKDKILKHILETNNQARLHQFTNEDMNKIERIVNEKYSTWEWNYGYSPKYNLEKSINTINGNIDVRLSVEKGIIISSEISGNALSDHLKVQIQKSLIGIKHKESSLYEALFHIFSNKLLQEIKFDEFVMALF